MFDRMYESKVDEESVEGGNLLYTKFLEEAFVQMMKYLCHYVCWLSKWSSRVFPGVIAK